MSFGKAFLASLLAVLVSGIIILIIFFGIIGAMVSGLEPSPLLVKKNTVLKMSFDLPIGDVSYTSFDKNSFDLKQKLGLNDILNGIETAQADDKIKGIYLNINNLNTGIATIKEIRDALEDFQSSGKFIMAYHENYSKATYYLSSVAKEVYVYPSGTFDFLGLGSEQFFLKGALEKLEVEMQIIRGTNNKFKSAVEPLMYTEMSEANREQTQKYLDALWNEMLVSIGQSRDISIAKLNEIADSAYIQKSGQAVDYKLADGVKYYDEVIALLESKVELNKDGEVEFFSFAKYAKKKAKKNKKANIAIIMAEGSIVDGEGEIGQIGGNSMSALVREARLDTTIKAVVLRINSPGGSALASDIIWREIILTKAVKPVIVSMGDVAASGGYYIACAADKIYASPNTITGSIGVFGVIPFTGDLLKNKLGVTIDRVQTNQHSILSFNKRLTTKEFKIIQKGVDDIYADFIGKVADGRGMKPTEVDSIGQGRVWAGSDAITIGLVDEFGGMNAAIADAASRVSISTENIKLKVYTTAKTDPMLETLIALQEQDKPNTSAKASALQTKVMDMFNFAKSIEANSGIQARLPYIYWID